MKCYEKSGSSVQLVSGALDTCQKGKEKKNYFERKHFKKSIDFTKTKCMHFSSETVPLRPQYIVFLHFNMVHCPPSGTVHKFCFELTVHCGHASAGKHFLYVPLENSCFAVYTVG